jgi:MFS family permease
MRIREDCVFPSSLLFTIALLCLVPRFWANVLVRHDRVWLRKLDDGYAAAAQTMSDLSVVSLGLILIALVVLWAGYIRRVRWTWFVMFIVVGVWAFPLLVLPLFRGKIALTWSEWLYWALSEPGSPRVWAESVLIFSLMVLALLLSIRSFFFVKDESKPLRGPSLKLIGLFALGFLVAALALFAWIRVGVLYEIPVSELNSTQRLPPPPPPPSTLHEAR